MFFVVLQARLRGVKQHVNRTQRPPASTTNRVTINTQRRTFCQKLKKKTRQPRDRGYRRDTHLCKLSVALHDRACLYPKYQVYHSERRTMVRTRSGDTALWPPWRCSCNRRGRCGAVLPAPAPASVAWSPCPSPNGIDHPVWAMWGVRASADAKDARRVMQQSCLVKNLIFMR